MRNKILGFTLLELVIVIIIIGILGTLGFAQFSRMIERSRGAEARSVCGSIRTAAAALWAERSSGTPPSVPADTFTNATVGIGTSETEISTACAGNPNSDNYYFSYAIVQNGGVGLTATAQRCIGVQGKQPGAQAGAGTLTLAIDFVAGTDTWGGTGGY